MRIEFFRSILRQDIGYFDVHSSAEDRFHQTYDMTHIYPIWLETVHFWAVLFMDRLLSYRQLKTYKAQYSLAR